MHITQNSPDGITIQDEINKHSKTIFKEAAKLKIQVIRLFGETIELIKSIMKVYNMISNVQKKSDDFVALYHEISNLNNTIGIRFNCDFLKIKHLPPLKDS